MTEHPSSASDRPSPHETVLLADTRGDRAAIVAAIVRACDAVPWLRDDGTDARSPQAIAAALIAVGDPLATEVIRSFRSHGGAIIAYEDGASGWRLGAQAKVLLAGATCLLDSASATFAEQLRGQLARHLETERAKRRDRDRITALMRGIGIIGASGPMLELFRLVVRVSALTELPILIEGQTGTGKEMVAHAIHHLDLKRQRGPFVAVNCSAINSNVAESELFGHRRGAFTGAERDYKGLFRLAEGGVLFLDEVSELDPSLQGKLLRVLQDHRVMGVGEDREVTVNVRVIAATNRSLLSMVATQRFREDLYHRLNVVTLHVPALSERLDDLGPLVDHFLIKYADTAETVPVRASPEFIRALREVVLPGNVRQLENVIRQALVAKYDALPLGLGDLPATLWLQLSERPGAQAITGGEEMAAPPNEPRHDAARVLSLHEWSLERSLAYYERWLVAAALERERGNQSRTARLLGITPRSVYNKIQKHGLSR